MVARRGGERVTRSMDSLMAIRSGFVPAGCGDDQTGGPGRAGEPLIVGNECRQLVAEQYH